MHNNNTSADTLQFHKLSDEKVERIHTASLEILERTGLRLYEPRALELLQRKGLRVEDGNRVRIPSSLVEWALSTAPTETSLYNRHGEPAMSLQGHNIFYGTGSDCPNVIDLRSGERRPGTLQDIVEATLVCDALPNIDFLMSFCIANDLDACVSGLPLMRAPPACRRARCLRPRHGPTRGSAHAPWSYAMSFAACLPGAQSLSRVSLPSLSSARYFATSSSASSTR